MEGKIEQSQRQKIGSRYKREHYNHLKVGVVDESHSFSQWGTVP